MSVLNAIIEVIERTIMENGTYLKVGGEFYKMNATSGYWVAISPSLPSDILDGQYLGVWTDEKDGKEYYDRSVWIADLDNALAVAKQHDQLAIWDNANECEVWVQY
jgi:hypothetical protein